MKIIHVVEAWKGGVASYVEVLIKDQLARGYNIKILADSNQLATDSRDLGVEIISYESSRKPWHFRKIAITLAKNKEFRCRYSALSQYFSRFIYSTFKS